MNYRDILQLGCWFSFGVSTVSTLAVIGRIVPEIGLTLVGLLIIGAISLAVALKISPALTPTASYLTLAAIFGLLLGVVN